MIKHSVKVVAITAPSPGAPAKLPSTRPVVRRPAGPQACVISLYHGTGLVNSSIHRQVPNSPSFTIHVCDMSSIESFM